MWKVFLALVSHRFLLLIVALAALQGGHRAPGSVWNSFFARLAEGPEVVAVETFTTQPVSRVLASTTNPLYWLVRFASKASGHSPLICLLFFSNLFLFLFLRELFSLFNEMVTTDISTLGAIFVVLWPTNYELSLGSSLSTACFFLTLSLRQAVNQRWWAAGIVAGVLALMDPIALALLPVFFYLFWSVQRFLPPTQWGRNLGFLLVPLFIGVVFSRIPFGTLLYSFEKSAFLNLFQMGHQKALFSQTFAGQTISLIFYFLGAVGAVFSNVNPMYRFFPLLVLLALTVTTPYSMIASRAPLAGVCMQGIASASSGSASQIASLMMVLLGAYEVYAIFAH